MRRCCCGCFGGFVFRDAAAAAALPGLSGFPLPLLLLRRRLVLVLVLVLPIGEEEAEAAPAADGAACGFLPLPLPPLLLLLPLVAFLPAPRRWSPGSMPLASSNRGA